MNATFALFAALALSPEAFAAGSADPCIGQDAVPNNWFVSMNEDGVSTRDGLLQTLTLLGTGGFTPSFIFAYDDSITQAKTIVVSFDPSYWSDNRGEQIKEATLSALAAIPGNAIRCNYYAYPAPAMGVRN